MSSRIIILIGSIFALLVSGVFGQNCNPNQDCQAYASCANSNTLECARFFNVNCSTTVCGGNKRVTDSATNAVEIYAMYPNGVNCRAIGYTKVVCGQDGQVVDIVPKSLACQDSCPSPPGGGENPECDPLARMSCEVGWDEASCSCSYSPVLIGLGENRFSLTSPDNGVFFDLDSDGTPELVAWTTPGAEDGFLALDRNGNGSIDDGVELFGDLTPQPPSDSPNGFLALNEYDQPENGGDGDFGITPSDGIFQRLRLWFDSNHDGRSQPEELRSLSEVGIARISLDYRESPRIDRHGNRFKYLSFVYFSPSTAGPRQRLAVDVFLRSY